MLQQTQVQTVIPYYERWMRTLPTLAHLARASDDQVLKLWEGLGYYRRARHLHRAARVIQDQYGGRVPTCPEQVLALPGIGRYTAGAICSIAFNQPVPVLDGNVMRVLTRLHGILKDPRRHPTRQHLWSLASTLVTTAARLQPGTAPARNRGQSGTARRWCSDLNQALMELGAVLCRPREPVCEPCPVRAFCLARKGGLTDRIPFQTTRPPTVRRTRAALFIERRGRILGCQRAATDVNGSLWELPTIDLDATPTLETQVARHLGVRHVACQHLGRVQHAIMRQRISLELVRVTGLPPGWRGAGRWLRPEDTERLAFSGAHRRLLSRVFPGQARPRASVRSARAAGVRNTIPPMPSPTVTLGSRRTRARESHGTGRDVASAIHRPRTPTAQ